jgi:hypothetical protein
VAFLKVDGILVGWPDVSSSDGNLLLSAEVCSKYLYLGKYV